MIENFSVVIPIHNEVKFIPYSLPSVFRLNPAEVILVFDRCTDDSLEVAKRITECLHYMNKTRFIRLDGPCDWKCRLAYVRAFGFKMAKSKVILTADADVILDNKIRNYVQEVDGNLWPVVVFVPIAFPLSFRNLLTRLILKMFPFDKHCSIYVFNRDVWVRTNDDEVAKQLEWSEDTYWQSQMTKEFNGKLVLSQCYHLRHVEDNPRHYLKGRMYWKVAHRSFLVTLLISIVLFRPSLIVGYVHERFGGEK